MPRSPVTRTLVALAGTALLTLTGATTAAAAAPAAVPAAVPAAAPAAVLASPPSGCLSLSTIFGQTCFEWVGDDQWVRDLDENGWTTVAEVRTNYGKFRECVAPRADDGWKECKFDHREDRCVSFRLIERQGTLVGRQSGWTLFYSTTNGKECGIEA